MIDRYKDGGRKEHHKSIDERPGIQRSRVVPRVSKGQRSTPVFKFWTDLVSIVRRSGIQQSCARLCLFSLNERPLEASVIDQGRLGLPQRSQMDGRHCMEKF